MVALHSVSWVVSIIQVPKLQIKIVELLHGINEKDTWMKGEEVDTLIDKYSIHSFIMIWLAAQFFCENKA